MHAQTIPVTEAQIRNALSRDAPEFAGLPLRPLAHGGTETRVARLGEHHQFRTPLLASDAQRFEEEARRVTWLAPHLPLDVPRAVASGQLATDPPLPWTVQRWIEGTDATEAIPADQDDLVDRLAEFLIALRQVPHPDAPPASTRGGPLAPQDDAFRVAIAEAHAKGISGLGPAIAAWDAGLAAHPWRNRPVWLHGDLVPGNLIVRDGHLQAVIDWSFVTVGDPAYDLVPAWFVFDEPARRRFLDHLAPDDATVARARACCVAMRARASLLYRQQSADGVVGTTRTCDHRRRQALSPRTG